MPKVSEERFRETSKYHGWLWHKYGDVRYCIKCGAPQPKSEMKPDFLSAIVATWVEAKNSDGKGKWKWIELLPDGNRKFQREHLKEHGGWLYIELGLGRAPGGKGAWLVPWWSWENTVEPKLLETGQRSLTYETQYNKDGSFSHGMIGADLLLQPWELKWTPLVGWTIPDDHIWWKTLHQELLDRLEEVERHLYGH